MLSLQDVAKSSSCPRLVLMGVTSQWGVVISTLVVCLGRSAQLLLDTRIWPLPFRDAFRCLKTPCACASAAILLVVGVHVITMVVSRLSLPEKFGLAQGPSCLDFLTSTDMFPRQRMGGCILCSAVIGLLSTALITIQVRKRRALCPPENVIRAGNLFRLRPFLIPLDDDMPHMLREPMAGPCQPLPGPQPEHAPDMNENSGSLTRKISGMGSSGMGSSGLGSSGLASPDLGSPGLGSHGLWSSGLGSLGLESPGLSFRQNIDAGPVLVECNLQRRLDFYDDEQTRHRVQSPPPLSQAPPLDPFHSPPPLIPPPQPPHAAEDGINNDANDAFGGFVIPGVHFDLTFSRHRSEENKKRFPHTRARHQSPASLEIRSDNDPAFIAARVNLLDKVVCLSTLLYIVSYTPLAFYLLYSKGKDSCHFSDQSFQPFLIILLLKASVDSAAYFIAVQMLG